jgi:hypothetical protein
MRHMEERCQMRRSLRFAAGAAALAAGVAAVPAIGSLTAQATIDDNGHVVVYRVGDGSDALTNAATPVFLDEYALDGTKVKTLDLPTAASGQQRALTAAGLSRSEGLITRSPDGSYLAVTGYDAEPGTTGPAGVSLTASDTSNVERTVGIVDGNNTIDTSTGLTGATAPQIARSAATIDGQRLWTAGGNGGLATVGIGGTGPVRVAGTANSNLNQVTVAGDQLFSSNSADSRLTKVGTGTPTTTGNALTALPGLPDTFLPFGYVLLDATDASYAGTGLDTLYYVDAADRAGVIHKYHFDGTTWQDAGDVDLEEGFGLTAFQDGSIVTLVATTPTSIVKLVDNNAAATSFAPTVSTVAEAAANTEFRGIAQAPVDPQGPSIIVRKPVVDAKVKATATKVAVSADVAGPKAISGVTVQLDSATPVAASSAGGSTYTANLPLKGLLSGKHTVTVSATDADGTNEQVRSFTYAKVQVPNGNIGPGKASLANNGKVTTNGFTVVNFASSPNGKGIRTTSTGTASFKAYGRSLTLYYQARPDAGKIRVTIDGTSKVIDAYAAANAVKSQSFGGLDLKSHDVVIKALGTKRAASTGTTVVLGYIKVGQW